MSFRVKGLEADQFVHLYGLSDEELRAQGVLRYRADSSPGFPDRIEMRDAQPGEHLLLLNHEHLPVDSPYRSNHAIFVREGARKAYDEIDQVPAVMAVRQLSVRAFDDLGMMRDAALVDGREAATMFERLLADPAVSYLHVHNAARGCYSGRVERA